METLFAFLIKASAGIALFYFVYWIFLRNETFHSANRIFLLLALASSVLIPLFPIHYLVLVTPEKNNALFSSLSSSFRNTPDVNKSDLFFSPGMNWEIGILFIYITGAALFLLRLMVQTFTLFYLILKHKIKLVNGFRIVENKKYGLPFSFFNIVFINPKFHTQDELPEILAHEKVHICENHWLDLLLIELLTVIFWFNPFIWFFERSIKQNHEYLADKGVISMGHGVARYQALLVNQLMGMQIIGITNNLNFALNTNRLKMMTKKKTPKIKRLKFVWALPALAFLLFAFAQPEYKVKKVEIKNSGIQSQKNEKKFVIHGKVVREENGEPLPGAAILVKGTGIGTVADRDGTFTLAVPNPKVDDETDALSTELVISYVGFQTLENLVSSSGKAIKNNKFTFKLKEGVIVIDTDRFSKGEIPPPPPKKAETPPPPPPPLPKTHENKGEEFYIVEDLAHYPGGYSALGQYVSTMEEKLARDKNIKGKAKIGFTVNTKGKVTNVKILEQDNKLSGKGGASIVMDMKDWYPGMQRGKKVPVHYILPVEFK